MYFLGLTNFGTNEKIFEIPNFLKTVIILVICSLTPNFTFSQFNPIQDQSFRNTITTAVPFLTIDGNAQSAAMGSIGVVASDLYIQNGLNQNPALLSRGKKLAGFQANYVPWLRRLVPNMYLAEASYFRSINKNNCLALSFKQFSYGDLQFMDDNGNVTGNFKPFEIAVGIKYAHNFSENFSIGTGIKYIYSDLTRGIQFGNTSSHPAKALAVELGADYRRFLIDEKTHKLKWNLGAAVLDIGNKVNYLANQDKNFLPQTLKIGTLFTFLKLLPNENYFAWDIQYQASKLLVPSPPIFAQDGFGNFIPDGNGGLQIERGMNPNVSALQAIVQSFHDAPGGGTEEFREITHHLGTESRLNFLENKMLLALRAGYFAQHFSKGDIKRISTGLGIGYSGFMLDLAYIVPTPKKNIIERTLFISLGARFNLNSNNFFKFKEI